MTPRRERLILAAIVIAGAALRFWSLGHGVPFALGPDEHFVLERALRMVRTGDPHPYFFDYPTFYIYIQALVIVLRFLAGAAAGLWSSLDEAPAAAFYVWGRATTALIGTATIPIAWRVARRFGLAAAIVASVMLAVDPMHARESRYVLTDVPQTFLVLLACLLSIRAVERPSRRAFGWAGVAVGLAAATKYTAAAAAVMPAVALLYAPGGVHERLKRGAWAAAGAAGAFLLAAPYTVLDLPAFLNGFAALSTGYLEGPYTPWQTYLTHLRRDLSWVGFAAALAALALAALRAIRPSDPARATCGIVASFVVAYFVFMSRHQLIFARYLLPMVPPVLVLIGALAGWAAARTSATRWGPVARRAVFAAVVIALAAGPAVTALSFAQRIARTTTAGLAYRWLLEHAPPGSRLAIESGGLIPSADRYVVDFLHSLIDWNLDAYRRQRTDFVIASSDAFGHVLAGAPNSPEAAKYRALFAQLDLMVSFVPSLEHPGAELRIYRLRKPEAIAR